jgi:hypothetical protein
MSTLAEALAPRSDQLNADDLIAGPRVLKITKARISKEDRATKIVLNFEGDNGKPWKPCKTMGRAMVMAWAITAEEQFVGKSVRVYRDPTVRFGDQGEVGGIRISHMSHIDKPVNVKLTVSQSKKGMFTFHPLVTDVPKQEAEDRAAGWAAGFIRHVSKVDSLDALTAFQAQHQPRIDDLRTKRPELADKVADALTRRADELSGNDFDDFPLTESNPTAAEGRPDEERGETLQGGE